MNKFEYSKKQLPEEQKSSLERGVCFLKKILKETSCDVDDILARRIEKKLEEKKCQIDELGGDTKEKVETSFSECDLANYWYVDHFRSSEEEVFEFLLQYLPEIPAILDLGIGTGRSSSLILDKIRDVRGDDISEQVAKNLHGVDIVDRLVLDSQENLSSHGVNSENILKGDFMNLPEQLKDESFDVSWILMNTLFYCTTERDLANVLLDNVEKKLKNGGIFLFDTIKLEHHIGIPEPEVINSFLDLSNLYDVLVRFYREKYIEDTEVNRFPVRGNTIGGGFYSREVITIDYLKDIIDKNNSNFKLLTENPIEKKGDYFVGEKALSLGRKWIKQNGIEDWLRNEIVFRSNGEGKPLYSFPKSNRPIFEKEDLYAENVEDILNEIAQSMVEGYTKQYYFFQKDSIEPVSNNYQKQLSLIEK